MKRGTPGRFIGSSQDPSWKRGVFEGAALACKFMQDGHDEQAIARWLEALAVWRFDADAGNLPPGLDAPSDKLSLNHERGRR